MSIRYKHSVYATVMSCGGEVIERRKLSTDEVAGFQGRYPVDKVAIESSTSIAPVLRSVERERVRYTRTG
jgi:hypothetical protein